MFKKCVTAKAAQRQLHIATVFFDLLKQRPMEEISISELCRQADIPRQVFYRYFDTREDVLTFIVSEMVGSTYEIELEHGAFASQEEYCCAFLEQIFLFWQKNMDVFAMANKSSGVYKALTQSVFLTAWNNSLHVNGANRPESVLTANTFLAGGLWALINAWVENGCNPSARELARRTAPVLLYPIIDVY